MTTMATRSLQHPSIQLSNRQRKYSVRREYLITAAGTILRLAGAAQGELGIIFVNDRRMRLLNARYRGQDRPTDVLAFRFDAPVPPHLRPLPPGGGKGRVRGAFSKQVKTPEPRQEQLIGDVVISLETAHRQATERRSGVHREVVRLLVHGILHLLGYDHERNEREAERMAAKERRIIRALAAQGIRGNEV